MAEVWKAKDKETIQSWIDALKEEASEDLSSWEIDFIDKCQIGLNHYGSLTEKMEGILERIYAEKTK